MNKITLKLFLISVIFSLLFLVPVSADDVKETAVKQDEIMVTDELMDTQVPAEIFFQKWIDEYVTWLILPDERDEWDELKTTQQKMDFIELFWLKRDPHLETMYNEFKEEYYDRLRYIYANFQEGDEPAIKSHRGMIYSILGEPASVDSTFSFQGDMFRRMDRFSRRGMVWVYTDQPGAAIPAWYQILFLKFGSNRWEIVQDYWGSKMYADAQWDYGTFGSRGFIPHRLNSILKAKKEYYVMNKDVQVLKDKLKQGVFSKEPIEISTVFKKDETGKSWGTLISNLKYQDIVFQLVDGKNQAVFKGIVKVECQKYNKVYNIDEIKLDLTDEELKDLFDKELKFGIELSEKPDTKGKCKIVVEIESVLSKMIYQSELDEILE